MTKVILPGQNVPISLPDGQINPVWYQALRSIELLTSPAAASAANSLRGNPTGVPAAETDVPLGAGLSFVGGALQGTSIDGINGAVTFGYGLARTAQAIRANLTSLTAALGANVALNNTGLFFDGPSVAQGSTGTWLAIGQVTCTDSSLVAMIAKLWDGTNVLSAGQFTVAAGGGQVVTLAGIITNPAGNLRISVRDLGTAAGIIIANSTGTGKDSTITAVRIA